MSLKFNIASFFSATVLSTVISVTSIAATGNTKHAHWPSLYNKQSLESGDQNYQVQVMTVEEVERAVMMIAGDGTDVGNGTGRRMNDRTRAWRAYVGSDWDTYSQSVEHSKAQMRRWVGYAETVLREAADEAMFLYVEHADYNTAIDILADAFSVLASSMHRNNHYMGPLTKLMVDRGLLLTHDMINYTHVKTQPRFVKVGVLNFLFGMVDTIIGVENGSVGIDRMQYIDYSYSYAEDYRRCGRFGNQSCSSYHERANYQTRFKELEKRMIRLARAQLRLTNSLTEVHAEVTEDYGRRRGSRTEEVAYPLGPFEVYLLAAEHVTHWAANDVAESLYGAVYTCAVGRLSRISDDLYRLNKSNGSYFRSREDGFAIATREITDLINFDLSEGSKHRRIYRPRGGGCVHRH